MHLAVQTVVRPGSQKKKGFFFKFKNYFSFESNNPATLALLVSGSKYMAQPFFMLNFETNMLTWDLSSWSFRLVAILMILISHSDFWHQPSLALYTNQHQPSMARRGLVFGTVHGASAEVRRLKNSPVMNQLVDHPECGSATAHWVGFPKREAVEEQHMKYQILRHPQVMAVMINQAFYGIRAFE